MARWFFLCAGIIACTFMVRIPCSAQEEDQDKNCKFMKVEGKIIDIDWVASTVVVKDDGDEITFLVPSETKITRGTDTITLSDLNIQDQVTVEYCDAHFAGLKALSITVKI